MSTIFKFLKKYGNEPLTQDNFTVVDSLILANMSYYSLEGYCPNLSKDKTYGLYITTLNNKKKLATLFNNSLIPSKLKKAFVSLIKTDRYKNARFNYFEHKVDTQNGSQFAACTIFVNDVTYVSFRGTDLTFAGWNENFEMCLSGKVSAQTSAVKYLEEVAKRIEGNFYVGGHSKGGNLAEYSTLNCSKDVFDRIIICDNFDGPGYYDTSIYLDKYNCNKGKFRKFVPTQSIVGTLLNSIYEYKIIKSKSVGLFQHNPFYWKLKDDDFKYARKRSKISVISTNTLMEWLNSVDEKKKKEFITNLYDLTSNNKIRKISDLKKKPLKKIKKMYLTYAQTDPKIRKSIALVLKSLRRITFRNIFQLIFRHRTLKLEQNVKFVTNEEIKKLQLSSLNEEEYVYQLEF